MLESLQQPAGSRTAADAALALLRELFPICRSITGDGVRRTLERIGELAPLERHEVATGTPLFDWQVPREWNVRDAHVSDLEGRRLIDFKAHSLHLVSYSAPLRARLTRDEIEPHLHSLPDQPDRIPYRTAYYRENWGFCLRHADRERLGPGPFDVVVDTTLAPGHLSWGECVIEGREPAAGEAVVYTHACHPSLANDNLSGIVVAAALARALRQERPRRTWRIVFAPGTIGALAWLAHHRERLARIRAGLVIGLLGDGAPLHYKPSRRGGTLIDRAALAVVRAAAGTALEFEPYGYDERQFNSPGFDLPFGRLTRSPNAGYPEYHSSGDDCDFVGAEALAGSIRALAAIVHAVDANRRWRNLQPFGEPQLGKRGLYGTVGGGGPGEREHALLWLLNQSDGERDLVEIAHRSRLPLPVLERAAAALEDAGLLAPLAEA